MRKDRFLIGILAGIGVLVVLSVALFFLRRGTLEYGPESTPDGVVRNYIVAIKKGDFERAKTYLAPLEPQPGQLTLSQTFNSQAAEIAATGIEIGQATIDGERALVQISLVRGSGGLFGESFTDQQPASLVLNDGAWKIDTMPYPFWDYSWGTLTPPAP